MVDGFTSDEAKLTMSYGFKKVISLLELMSLSPHLNAHAIFDFGGSKEAIEKTK